MSHHPLSEDDAEAARRYQELFRKPSSPETHSEMGVILRQTGLSEETLLEEHPQAA